MQVKLLGIKGTWREVADAARTTAHKEPGIGEPSSGWGDRGSNQGSKKKG